MQRQSDQSSGANNQMGRLCPKCQSFMATPALYCALDGTKLNSEAATVTAQGQILCPSCSRLLPRHVLFCPSDGTMLSGEKSTPKKPGAKEESYQNASNSIGETESLSIASKRNALDATRSILIQENEGKTSLIGTILDDRYRIEGIIAEGGMAILYRAHQIGMDRTVAIKIMLSTVTQNAQAAERFAQECKLAARLNHPNIVSVHDVGFISPRQPYLVMEYVDGVPLSQILAESGPPSVSTSLAVISQVLKGLEEAHAAGIIHRDLKPDNILLQKKSHRCDLVKIVDFGIASLTDTAKRLTKMGSFIGTPAYMAPEQFKGKPLDTRVDLYSIGIMLFELLTGDVPFDGETPDAVMMKHLIDLPPVASELRSEIPQSLDAIINRALAKDPVDRFQTASEFCEALEPYLNPID